MGAIDEKKKRNQGKFHDNTKTTQNEGDDGNDENGATPGRLETNQIDPFRTSINFVNPHHSV